MFHNFPLGGALACVQLLITPTMSHTNDFLSHRALITLELAGQYIKTFTSCKKETANTQEATNTIKQEDLGSKIKLSWINNLFIN